MSQVISFSACWKSVFDRATQYDWSLPNIDRSLDSDRVEEYLNLLPTEADREFVRDIINHTLYVNFEVFYEALLSSFEAFRDRIDNEPFYLLLPSTKIGSEYWVTTLLWTRLRQLNLIEILNETTTLEVFGQYNILILDDSVYSGINVISLIDEFTYNRQLNRPRAYNHLHFHLLVPFATQTGLDQLKGFLDAKGYSLSTYETYSLPLLPSKRYYSDDESKDFELKYTRFGIEMETMPTVYFDHKVAGPMSTYYTIYIEGRVPESRDYGSLLKAQPSSEMKEKLAELAREDGCFPSE